MWPRSKRAKFDFILVGVHGGVVVVDAKSWAELEIRDGSLYRGEPARTSRPPSSAALIDSLSDGIAHTGLTCTSISAAMVSPTPPPVPAGTGEVLGDRDVVSWLAGLGHRLSAEQVAVVVAAIEECCPKGRRPSRDRASSPGSRSCCPHHARSRSTRSRTSP